jgi:hypothetical protein
MPFVMTGVDLWTDGKINDLLTLWKHGELLWPHGELLLVATAIGADAAGGLIASGNNDNQLLKAAKLVSAGGCILLALGSAWWYQKIQDSSVPMMTARIVEGSGVILLATLGVSLVCKALAED